MLHNFHTLDPKSAVDQLFLTLFRNQELFQNLSCRKRYRSFSGYSKFCLQIHFDVNNPRLPYKRTPTVNHRSCNINKFKLQAITIQISKDHVSDFWDIGVAPWNLRHCIYIWDIICLRVFTSVNLIEGVILTEPLPLNNNLYSEF